MDFEEVEQELIEDTEHLNIREMLYHCGHKALGLSIREALEIDPMYRYELERE